MKLRIIPVFILVVSAVLLLKVSVGAQGPAPPSDPADNSPQPVPSGVELVSQIEGAVYGVFLQGDYAYLAAGPRGLRIVDKSNPRTPSEVGFYADASKLVFAQNVAVAGRYAYVADLIMGLLIIDVSNRAAPSWVESYSAEGFYDVAIVGRYAYVADFGGALRIIDVSDPTAPSQVGSYVVPGNLNVRGVAVKGGYAYVAATGAGLRIVDIVNPTQPIEVGFFLTPGNAWDVAVEEGYAYIADEAGGVRIVDVSDPEYPTERGYYLTPEAAQGLTVLRNHAYVAAKGGGLRIINIANPLIPSEDASHLTAGNAWDVAVAEGFVFVTDGNPDGGLFIYYFAPPSSITISPGQGGELVSPFDDTSYSFPPGAFGTLTDTVIITHTPRFAGDVPSYAPKVDIGHIFELTAVYSSTGKPAQLAPGFTYTMTVRYRQSELGFAVEKTLDFYYYDDDIARWVAEPTSLLDIVVRTVAATPNHLSYWAVLGDRRGIFLPVILRSP